MSYKFPVFVKAMNEYFDHSDEETRKVLLAVNETDQSSILLSLTSKLYDSIIDKVDDINFDEIPASKGNISKLSNFDKMVETCTTIKQILTQYKQPTEDNIDQIIAAINNMNQLSPLFVKAYMLNMEMPIVMYNTITMAIIMSISYMISNCIEFIKTPTADSFETIINNTSLVKTKNHLLFTNLIKFNAACKKGEIEKVIDYVIKSRSKQFLGGALVVGETIAIVGIMFNIIPIMRELIYFYYYNRVRISDYFALQSDLLVMNVYKIKQNEPDKFKAEKDSIIKQQTAIANTFRKIADAVAIDCKQSEKNATKELTSNNKKYKTTDIMDSIPDSAGSSIF